MDQSKFVNHDKWKKENFALQGQNKPQKYSYYRRSFGSYCAHVFFIMVSAEQELSRCWESIDNQIAFYIQQDTEAMIEKSNFYVCYFVNQKVPAALKRQIETDEFCSKKYVFDTYDTEKTEEEYCDYVEQKLFSINVDEKEAADCDSADKLKIKEIEVENFRVFEGQKNISFACENNPEKAADLVVIYGPNGTGKTTVLDSVEYTMTGRVGRLTESLATQKDTKNYSEPVYHNRGKKESDAYTMFITDRGERVSRMVSKYNPSGSDLKRNSNQSNVSRKILGSKNEEQEKWSTFLLTHEVLDAFLSGTNPEEKYSLWVSKNSLLTDENKAFTDAMKAYSKANSALNRKNDEAKKTKEELEKLKEQKDILSNVRGLIKKYNEDSDDKLNEDLFPDGHQLNVEIYDWFMTRIRGVRQEISQSSKSLSDQSEVFAKMQGIGFETIERRMNELSELEKKCDAQEKRVKNTKQCERARQKKETQAKALEKLQQQQSVYGQILEKWEPVMQLRADYENLGKRAKDYQKEITDTAGKIENARKLLTGYQDRKTLLERYAASEKNALKCLENIEKITAQRKEVREALSERARSLKKAEIKRDQLKAELDRYSAVTLPEYIAEDTAGKILTVIEIIPKDIRTKLYQTCLDYAMAKKETDDLNRAADINKEIVLKLQKDAQEFLKVYTENTRCPVCGHDYGSVDALASRFTMALVQNSDADERQKEELSAKIKQLEAQYRTWKKTISDLISSKTEDLKEQYQKADAEFDTILEEKKSLEDKENSYNMEIEAEKEKMYSYGIRKEPLNLETVKSFYRQVKDSLSEYIKRIADCSKKAAECEAKKVQLEEQLQVALIAQKDLCASPEYALAELGQAFRFDREKVQSRKEKLDQETEYKAEELKETDAELEKLKDYYFTYSETETAELENYRQKLASVKQENRQFLAYKDKTAKELENLMQENEKQLESARKRSEILTDILNENQLRDYFAKYSDLVKKVEALEKEQKKLEARWQEKKSDYESRSEELCEGLQKLHNQKLAIEIFNKINPNMSMDGFDYELSFTDADVPKPRLEVWVKDENENRYKPEYYFSTAQLNTIVFSIYLARALKTDNMALKTILVDDPVGHFDDINILSFADFLRILITEFKCQIILTTFDMKVYRILERKFDPEHYPSRFIDLEREMSGK